MAFRPATSRAQTNSYRRTGCTRCSWIVARALGQGVANLGVRPTIQGDGQRLLEVHLFNFEEELYGEELRVHFAERLRDEQRFTSLDELKAQIARDSERARQTLATRTPPPDGDGAWG